MIPAGDNSTVDFGRPRTTYWLAPGVHTLGTDRYAQIIPGEGASFIGGPGAVLDGMNRNVYAFGQTARHVAIRHLTIRNFGTGLDNFNEGVVNHDAADGWIIERNTISDNDGAGVFVGDDNVVRSNCLRNNGQYGLSAYSEDGVSGIEIDHNEIAGNNVDDWESRIEGCGCAGGAKLWEVAGAVITDNWIRDNHGVGLWGDTNNRDVLVAGNLFEGNDDEAFWYEASYNATIRYNTFVRNALVKGKRYASDGDDFPVAAVYLSEAGGDARVDGQPRIDISHNHFEDNWGGVTLWENADRFCGSPANTSTGSCTLGGSASPSTCVAPTIDSQPYYSDCRWKTQNVHVHDNEFWVDPAAIGCSATLYCARSAVVSNYGTFPSWSPYHGDAVQDAITFHQHNRWYRNDIRRTVALPGLRDRADARLVRLACGAVRAGRLELALLRDRRAAPISLRHGLVYRP